MTKRATPIFSLIFVFLFITALHANAQTALFDSPGKFIELEKKSFTDFQNNRVSGTHDYTRTTASANFDINFYRCEWEIDPTIRFIKGKVTSYFIITSSTDKIVFDLSDTLTVDSVTWHGNQIVFQKIANDGLQLQFPSILNTGQKDSVSIYYNGVPRNFASYKPFVLSSHNAAPIIWTLSEPFGAKEWWPCKNGLNDKADSIDIVITNPAMYQASSNGVMVQESIVNTNKISVWKHRYPIASYLVALAVTNYTVLKDTVTIGGNTMNLVDYAYPENVAYFNSQRIYTKYALTLFGRLFGDYPFAKEKYGFTQIGGGGGMEHQTNTFLNNPEISLLEHETGHQWFGDKITCGSWEDIWLNEGFATYCQILFNENIDTANYFPILKNITRDITTQPNGSVWVNDTTNASRIFSAKLTYYKGAYLLHMLRWRLGDDVFFRAIKKYISDPSLQYKFARTADLKRNLEEESGKDLSVFFAKWFYGEGFPSYNCTWMQNKNNWAYIQINQTTSHPSVSFYDMPVQLWFKNSSRDTLITLNNQRNGETYWVNPGFMADTMLVDPNYHILAKERISQRTQLKSTLENDIRIYPNPAVDKLNVSILNPTSSQITIQLYNMAGQLVYKIEKSLSGQDELFTVPVVQLAGGAYLLSIADNKTIRIKKMIMK